MSESSDQDPDLESELVTAADNLLIHDMDPIAIENRLMERGVDRATAASAVTAALEARVQGGNQQTQAGWMWVVIGLGFTIVTCAGASEFGGTYIVAWGPVGYGVWRVFSATRMVNEWKNHLADRDFASAVDCPSCRERIELMDEALDAGRFICPACEVDVELPK